MTGMRALLVALVLLAPRVAEACAPAPPQGSEVLVAAEEAIIVWDAPKKTEHFIRRAQFQSTAKDFGFLVPTPSVPALAESNSTAFGNFAQATKEAVKHETSYEPEFTCLSSFMLSRGVKSAAPAEQAVRVLSIENVAGYEAAILQADDAEKLRGWLAGHGYDARPELTAWIQPYVANKWTITAFKVVGSATAAVRMTFATDTPVFPYREPADQRATPGPERVLRVFLIASEKLTGRVGPNGKFPGELRFARPTSIPPLLAGALPPELVPPNSWLHDFVDRSTPRPGVDDLYFERAADQNEVIPAPRIEVERSRIYLPVDIAAFIAIAAYLVVRVKRRAR